MAKRGLGSASPETIKRVTSMGGKARRGWRKNGQATSTKQARAN